MKPSLRHRLAAWSGGLLLALAGSGSAHAYSSVIAFGDSLSDNGKFGNNAGATAYTSAADQYGFQRFSNGPVWIEDVTQSLGTTLLDLAYGGATSGWNNPAAGLSVTGLQWQVAAYGATFHTIANDALVSVWAGGNDLLNYASNPALYNPVAAATNVGNAIQNLIAMGGRNFIVPNLSFNYMPSAAPWMSVYNATLASTLAAIDAQPGVNVFAIDLTQLWYTGLNTNGSVTNPNGQTGPYAFYDTVHPSAEGHQQIANYVMAQVPEPGGLLMLVTGIAILAATSRRTRFLV